MRHSEAGFSMIEALVAMTVLAVTAVGLLSAAEETVRTTAKLDDRVLLRWVAQDQIALARAGQTTPTTLTAWGRQFTVQPETTASTDPAIAQMTFKIETPEGAALRLGTYVLKGPAS